MLLLPLFYACSKEAKKGEFTGTWVDKALLEDKFTGGADSLAPFPIIIFEEEQVDSVFFYYDHGLKVQNPTHYSYNSYFFHFDKSDEYFFLLDYNNTEMVFSDLKKGPFRRFKKLDRSLKKEEVMQPSFNIDSFIHSLR